MFIDYITLLLLNMTAGLFLLSLYVIAGLGHPNQRRWAPGFGAVGLVALVFGGHMTMNWPVIGAYNSAYGEMSVLFGVLFLGAAVAMAAQTSLVSLGIYAFFAGLAAVLLGIRIYSLEMTLSPAMTAVGFILSGLGGIFAAPTLTIFRGVPSFRIAASLILLAAAFIWAVTCALGYWGHMESFKDWVPLAMREAPAP